MDFANVETWIELKSHKSWDPFVDPPGDEDEMEQPGAGDEMKGVEEDIFEDAVDALENADDNDLDFAEEPLNQPREEMYLEEERDFVEEAASLDKKHPFENSTRRGKHTRAQLASYAGATMSVQFRTHLFTIVICEKFARFIRWDRSCAIVTRAFDYARNPALFLEFFSRFAQLKQEQRGIDMTVQPALAVDAARARKALVDYPASLWLGKTGKVLKDNVVSIVAQPFLSFKFRGRKFIIPAPHCDEQGLYPFGRATRARTAVELTETGACVLFLKEYWRDAGSSDSGAITEAEVYEEFKTKQIQNVPTMSVGGDTGSETKGQDWIHSGWLSCRTPLRARFLKGHCIILNEVGRGLLTFRYAAELIECLRDGMSGMVLPVFPAFTNGTQGTKRFWMPSRLCTAT